MALDPMRSLVDVLPGAACMHRDGRVVHANPAFVAALGFIDATDLLGTPVDEQVCTEDRLRFQERTRELSATAPTAAGRPSSPPRR